MSFPSSLVGPMFLLAVPSLVLGGTQHKETIVCLNHYISIVLSQNSNEDEVIELRVCHKESDQPALNMKLQCSFAEVFSAAA